MSKLKRMVESDPAYLKVLESLSPEDQASVARDTELLINQIDDAFDKLSEELSTDGGPDKVITALKEALECGIFNNNDGVSPVLWPERN
jgi:hypothetical protein